MSLETIVMYYSGTLVGVFAATIVIALCVATNYAIKLIQPLLWEAWESSLLWGHESP